jgi:hypothetical protein
MVQPDLGDLLRGKTEFLHVGAGNGGEGFEPDQQVFFAGGEVIGSHNGFLLSRKARGAGEKGFCAEVNIGRSAFFLQGLEILL